MWCTHHPQNSHNYFHLRPAPRWPAFCLGKEAESPVTSESCALPQKYPVPWHSRNPADRALCGSPLFIKNCFYVTEARKSILYPSQPQTDTWDRMPISWGTRLAHVLGCWAQGSSVCTGKVKCVITVTMAGSKWSIHIFLELNFLIR